jgi:Spy/CpxP family protein refolding chaperone
MDPKTKTVLLIFTCFVLGTVAGVVAQKYYFSPRASHRPDYAQVRREFAQRLRLDSLQVGQVDSVMDFHRKKMEDIRKLFTSERDSLRSDIRKLLTPVQTPIYEEYIKGMEARESRRREGEKQPSK